jgi:hypothetical protein
MYLTNPTDPILLSYVILTGSVAVRGAEPQRESHQVVLLRVPVAVRDTAV